MNRVARCICLMALIGSPLQAEKDEGESKRHLPGGTMKTVAVPNREPSAVKAAERFERCTPEGTSKGPERQDLRRHFVERVYIKYAEGRWVPSSSSEGGAMCLPILTGEQGENLGPVESEVEPPDGPLKKLGPQVTTVWGAMIEPYSDAMDEESRRRREMRFTLFKIPGAPAVFLVDRCKDQDNPLSLVYTMESSDTAKAHGFRMKDGKVEKISDKDMLALYRAKVRLHIKQQEMDKLIAGKKLEEPKTSEETSPEGKAGRQKEVRKAVPEVSPAVRQAEASSRQKAADAPASRASGRVLGVGAVTGSACLTCQQREVMLARPDQVTEDDKVVTADFKATEGCPAHDQGDRP